MIGAIPPLNQQKLVYFDSNVYIDAYENQDLSNKVQLVGVKYNIFYTHENIQELLAPRYKDRITEQLSLINCITYGNHFRSDLNGCRFEKLHPFEVYKEIANDPSRDAIIEAENQLSDMQTQLALSWRDEIRDKLGLNQQELNNMSPKNAIAHIDDSLGKAADLARTEGKESPNNIEEMIAPILNIHYDAHFKKQGINDPAVRDALIRAMLAIAFSLFDQFGYWSDNPKENYQFRNTNLDMLHALAGKEAIALISDDRRFRNKTLAVYHHFGIPCKVMPTIEGLDYLIRS
jgi:hypothetical protein